MISAVFDTNFWVAALRTKNANSASRLILEACRSGSVEMVLSKELLTEHVRVFERPLTGLSTDDANGLRDFLIATARMVTIGGEVYGCADPDDDKVLETAISGRAQYIVTFDKALLDNDFRKVAAAKGVEIVDYGQFLAILRSAGNIGKAISELPATAIASSFESLLTDTFQQVCELYRARVDLESRAFPQDDEEATLFINELENLEYQMKRALTILRLSLLTPVSKAKQRADAAFQRVISWRLMKAERLAREGRLALTGTGVFLDDVCPDGAEHSFTFFETIRRAAEARDYGSWS